MTESFERVFARELRESGHPWAMAFDAPQRAVDYFPDAGLPDVSERSKWRGDPVAWARDRAGLELWSKQREILQAVSDHRRVAVHSCHSTGKTFNAAVVTSWWIDSHPPGEAFVITTAPTGAQVKAQLWREINRLHARGWLPGRTNLTEWYLDNELVAFGRKPSEHNESAFQGIHSKYVLVVLDEACGIPLSLWNAAESIASSINGRILAIGNPDANDVEFSRVCMQPETAYKVIHVSYEHVRDDEFMSDDLRDMLISETWVEERRYAWGEKSALFWSKCLGQFPQEGTDPWVVVPFNYVTKCRYLELLDDVDEITEAGIDVGAGSDRSVIVVRRGGLVVDVHEFRDPDPVSSVGEMVNYMLEYRIRKVKIDVIGVGWNVYGRLRELSSLHNPSGERAHQAEIVPVDFRRRARRKKRFINRRAEVWWDVGRENSRAGAWDLGVLTDDQIAELTTTQYRIEDSSGRIKIEPKEEVRKRLGRSPDVADSLLLAFYEGIGDHPVNTDAVEAFADSEIMSGVSSNASPFSVGGSHSVDPRHRDRRNGNGSTSPFAGSR